MDKSNLGFIAIIGFIGLGCVGAFNSHQKAQKAKMALNESNIMLKKASNKSMHLINETGKGIVYLAPKGSVASKDDDGDKLLALLKLLFKFNSVDDFKAQSNVAKSQMAGEFSNYWLHGGIENNYELLKNKAAGRSLKRFGDITLTKYNTGHYMAIIQTGVLIGGTDRDDIQPDTIILDCKLQNNGKWNMTRIKDATHISQTDLGND